MRDETPITVSVTINGTLYGPTEVPEGTMMIDFLHEYAGLTGTKFGCGIGVCHACVIVVDKPDGSSETMRTCINAAGYFNGKRIRTIEGYATTDENGAVVDLTPLQRAFLEHFAFQCGYCTSGMLNEATVLLERLKQTPVSKENVEQVIEQAMGEHICRCTGYVRYYQAIRDVIVKTPGLTTG